MNNLTKIKVLEANGWLVTVGGSGASHWAQVRRGGRIFHCDNVDQASALADALSATAPFNPVSSDRACKDDKGKPPGGTLAGIAPGNYVVINPGEARALVREHQNKNTDVLSDLSEIYENIRLVSTKGGRKYCHVAANTETRDIIGDRVMGLGYSIRYFKFCNRETGIEIGWQMITPSKFTDPLDVEYVDGRKWKLLSSFYYDDARYQEIIEVPSNFVTDFASIPRALWSIIPPTGQYGKAAVIHDWLYQNKGKMPDKQYTRAEADLVFRDAMAVLGVGGYKRQTMYLAVRSFGPRW